MKPHDALLQLLADGEFHSGQACAGRLKVSRTSVHNAIDKLSQTLGLVIDRIPGRGYRINGGLDLLCERQLRDALSPEIEPLVVLPAIDSTNRYLVQQLPMDKPLALCLTEYQTAGRGRHGKAWVSPFASNCLFSLRVTFARDLAALRGLSLLVGLAIARFCHTLNLTEVGLKWPNDIVVQQQKLGGVLCEVAGDVAGPCTVIIGVGLNIDMLSSSMPSTLLEPCTDLYTLLRAKPRGVAPLVLPNRTQIAIAVVRAIVQHLQSIETTPLSQAMTDWQAFDSLYQQPVTWQSAQGTVSGIALGINENGELRVRTHSQTVLLNSGEVSGLRLQH